MRSFEFEFSRQSLIRKNKFSHLCTYLYNPLHSNISLWACICGEVVGFDGKKNTYQVIFMELIHGQSFAKLSNKKQKI